MNTMDLYALNSLPNDLANCYDRETLYRMDQRLIEVDQLPLMERAGRYAAYCIRQCFPDIKKVAIFAGTGNNGGDAWICARHLQLFGIEVQCFYTGRPKTPLALEAFERYQCAAKNTPVLLNEALPQLEAYDVLVDGLLGIGLTQALKPEMQRLIEHLNASNVPGFSLDVPSGIDAETGQVTPIAVKATHTLVFVGLKAGLLTGQGRDFSGEIIFSALGIPRTVYEEYAAHAKLAVALPNIQRPMDSHKGLFGEIHIIGGAPSMAGAVLLCGQAAQRSGAGLVRILTHENHVNQLATALPETLFHEATTSLHDPSVRVLGPGLGEGAWGEALFHQHIAVPGALVVDASALNLLVKYPCHSDRWVLTPHPKEAARLLGCEVSDIQKNRVESAKKLAGQYGGWVVLKGSGTIITNGSTAYLCPYGNPAMASAGMGDVLAGIIAALLSAYEDPERAAVEAVALHAHTADQLVERYGWGLQASDVAKNLLIKVRS